MVDPWKTSGSLQPRTVSAGPKTQTQGSHLPPLIRQDTHTKLTQKQIDASAYRLSRVPNRYAQDQREIGDYAKRWAKSNQVDDRPPSEKLGDIPAQLADCSDDDTQFALLVQQKALCSLAYGENSAETARSYAALAHFYCSHGLYDSCLRNANRARDISKDVLMDTEERLSLAVDTADAAVNGENLGDVEKGAAIASAQAGLEPFVSVNGDPLLLFRRDLALARIQLYYGSYPEAVAFYRKAAEKLGGASLSQAEQAKFYVEAADCAARAKDRETTILFLEKAKAIYEASGDSASLDEVNRKLTALGETEEPPAQEEAPPEDAVVADAGEADAIQSAEDQPPAEEPVPEETGVDNAGAIEGEGGEVEVQDGYQPEEQQEDQPPEGEGDYGGGEGEGGLDLLGGGGMDVLGAAAEAVVDAVEADEQPEDRGMEEQVGEAPEAEAQEVEPQEGDYGGEYGGDGAEGDYGDQAGEGEYGDQVGEGDYGGGEYGGEEGDYGAVDPDQAEDE